VANAGKTKLLTSLHERWISPKLSVLFPIVVATLEGTENQFMALLCRGEVASSMKTHVTLNAHVGSPDPFYASIDTFQILLHSPPQEDRPTAHDRRAHYGCGTLTFLLLAVPCAQRARGWALVIIVWNVQECL
jgi:hypothetical protein